MNNLKLAGATHKDTNMAWKSANQVENMWGMFVMGQRYMGCHNYSQNKGGKHLAILGVCY